MIYTITYTTFTIYDIQIFLYDMYVCVCSYISMYRKKEVSKSLTFWFKEMTTI